MIGWTRCHYACGCIDEDACVKAPKNVALRAPEKPTGEFCRSCGSSIPHRPHEGTCVDCQDIQVDDIQASMRLTCVHGHDRCYLGTDPDCPYCERVHDASSWWV